MLRRLQLATQGLVSNQRIMQEFSQAARAGVLSQAEIADAFSLVTQAAQDMGRSVDDSIRALGTALSTGELGSLAELGVNVGQVRTEVTAAGISAESAAGRTRMLQLAMGQLRADMPDLGTGLDNTGDGLTRISVAAGNARDAMANSFGTNQELSQQLTAMAATVDTLTPAFVRLGNVLANSVLIAFNQIIPILIEVESILGDTTHRLSSMVRTAMDQGETLARQRGSEEVLGRGRF